MTKKILVLCVDRDDDIGRKTRKKGPFIGREKNLEVAISLALADPQDSDSNAIFEAIKTYDELKKEKKNVEVATVTGNPDVGVKSDELLTEQIKKVVKKTGSDRIILVSDGAEDEYIIPLIQNYGELLSVKRVVVKQSEKLEGMYYMIHDFINDPKMAKIFLGVPALSLLLYAIFGDAGWRFVLGGVGLYLLIKGFQLEGFVASIFEELKTAFTSRRMSFFFYMVAILIGLIGLKSGYDSMLPFSSADLIEVTSAFIHGSIGLLFLSSLSLLMGRVIVNYPKERDITKYLTFAALGFGLSIVGFEASNVVLNPEIGLLRLFAAITFGVLLVALTLTFERFAKR
ncbi:MAG: hypothetical protein DRP11_00195 [Candidatus Aenigmatarchaeota archaeon]|nr:MAG: hypothetical protein DRP11_00195 [Candidatus Aenigmarchaeota archaeon]